MVLDEQTKVKKAIEYSTLNPNGGNEELFRKYIKNNWLDFNEYLPTLRKLGLELSTYCKSSAPFVATHYTRMAYMDTGNGHRFVIGQSGHSKIPQEFYLDWWLDTAHST